MKTHFVVYFIRYQHYKLIFSSKFTGLILDFFTFSSSGHARKDAYIEFNVQPTDQILKCAGYKGALSII